MPLSEPEADTLHNFARLAPLQVFRGFRNGYKMHLRSPEFFAQEILANRTGLKEFSQIS